MKLKPVEGGGKAKVDLSATTLAPDAVSGVGSGDTGNHRGLIFQDFDKILIQARAALVLTNVNLEPQQARAVPPTTLVSMTPPGRPHFHILSGLSYVSYEMMVSSKKEKL